MQLKWLLTQLPLAFQAFWGLLFLKTIVVAGIDLPFQKNEIQWNLKGLWLICHLRTETML